MKKINILLILFLGTVIFSCRINMPTNCFPQMTEVNVHSGNIDGLKFIGNSDYIFKFEDDAIGLIDSNTACTKKNALYDYDNHVYIFENNKLPNVIDQKLYFKLRNAVWKDKKQYKLKDDAEILVDEYEYKIYIREKNTETENKMYWLKEAIIDGQKVYRYWDEYYIEDYKNFLDYHHLLRPIHIGEIMIDKIRGINANHYETTPGAPGRPVLTVDGRVQYTTGTYTPTPLGTTDKIYFRKSGAAINYRIKHVYHTEDFRKKLEKFYDVDKGLIKGEYVKKKAILARLPLSEEKGTEKVKFINLIYGDITSPDDKNKLVVALREFYEPYLENNIEGYQMCSGAVKNLNRSKNLKKSGGESSSINLILKIMAEIDSPPLPTGGGGG